RHLPADVPDGHPHLLADPLRRPVWPPRGRSPSMKFPSFPNSVSVWERPLCETLFRGRGRDGKQSFPEGRSQTDFGNEEPTTSHNFRRRANEASGASFIRSGVESV